MHILTEPPRRGTLDVDYGFIFGPNGKATGLAVGNACSRNSRRWSAVVTLCGQAELDNSRANYIEVCPPPTLMVPLDEMEGGASRHLPIISAFVRHYRQGVHNSQVLIHCDAGISRGPAIAVFLLMGNGTTSYLENGTSYTEEEAVAAIKRARPLASPSPVILREVRVHVEYHRFIRSQSAQLQIDT